METGTANNKGIGMKEYRNFSYYFYNFYVRLKLFQEKKENKKSSSALPNTFFSPNFTVTTFLDL